MAASGDAIAANALASSGATIELLERQVREGSVEAFDLNPPMILRHRGEIRLHMWVRNGPKETIIVRRGRTARPAGAPVMRKLERSQQSNGTRAAEAQRAHLTSSNLLSAASICIGGAFRCCTRGTGIKSLAATRPGSDVGFPSPIVGKKKSRWSTNGHTHRHSLLSFVPDSSPTGAAGYGAMAATGWAQRPCDEAMMRPPPHTAAVRLNGASCLIRPPPQPHTAGGRPI